MPVRQRELREGGRKNVQLFICVVRDSDPKAVVKDLLKMPSLSLSSVPWPRTHFLAHDRLSTQHEPGAHLQWSAHSFVVTMVVAAYAY